MDGKTRSEAFYLDDDHHIVDSEKATKVVINEYDEDGHMVREIWGVVHHDRTRKNRGKQRLGFLGRLLQKLKS